MRERLKSRDILAGDPASYPISFLTHYVQTPFRGAPLATSVANAIAATPSAAPAMVGSGSSDTNPAPIKPLSTHDARIPAAAQHDRRIACAPREAEVVPSDDSLRCVGAGR